MKGYKQMNEKRNISSMIIYGIIVIVLLWGIFGSLYLGAKELLAAFGHLINWEWANQFFDASKGIGMHIFAGIFLLALSVFLAFMGRSFLTWIREDTKKRKAREYKRRNYR